MGQLFSYDVESMPDGCARRAEIDAFLRQQGWKIHSRPADGEALWNHPCLGLFAESDALDYEECVK